MSASTVSVTANPATASRRKPVLIGDKKSGLDLVGADAIAASPINGIGDNSRGKELSRTIRAATEAVLERSTHSLPTNSATNLPRRANPRKGGSTSSAKPRWKRIVSVLTKNFILILMLLLLVQMVRRLIFNQGAAVSVFSSDYERKIAEVEAFLKTTTKMMQVQVDAVDRKFENEIAGLKVDLGRKIDDDRAEFSGRLRELDGRVESVEKSLISSPEWLSKDEFDRFVEEIKAAKGLGDGSDLKPDEIRAFAREIVEKEIEKHAADGLGRVDYALASGGAMVLKHSEPFVGDGMASWLNRVHSSAVKMLQPSFGEPGQCFPLKGNSGFVQIKLRTAIIPEAITLEHVAKVEENESNKDCQLRRQRIVSASPALTYAPSAHRICVPDVIFLHLISSNGSWININSCERPERSPSAPSTSAAFDRSSAPKDCKVFGWLRNEDNTEKMHLLTEFAYDLEKSSAQTFNVRGGSGIVDTIRLEFTSNHGSPTHTCIYRLRVHGHGQGQGQGQVPDSFAIEP